MLAPSCDRLISSDIAPSAVARARLRCGHLNHVSVRCADLTEHLPDGPFNLIILREVAHSMSAAEVLRTGLSLSDRLASGGEFIVLHGVSPRIAAPMAGPAIHSLLSANLPRERVRRERGVAHSLDCWVKH